MLHNQGVDFAQFFRANFSNTLIFCAKAPLVLKAG